MRGERRNMEARGKMELLFIVQFPSYGTWKRSFKSRLEDRRGNRKFM